MRFCDLEGKECRVLPINVERVLRRFNLYFDDRYLLYLGYLGRQSKEIYFYLIVTFSFTPGDKAPPAWVFLFGYCKGVLMLKSCFL